RLHQPRRVVGLERREDAGLEAESAAEVGGFHHCKIPDPHRIVPSSRNPPPGGRRLVGNYGHPTALATTGTSRNSPRTTSVSIPTGERIRRSIRPDATPAAVLTSTTPLDER